MAAGRVRQRLKRYTVTSAKAKTFSLKSFFYFVLPHRVSFGWDCFYCCEDWWKHGLGWILLFHSFSKMVLLLIAESKDWKKRRNNLVLVLGSLADRPQLLVLWYADPVTYLHTSQPHNTFLIGFLCDESVFAVPQKETQTPTLALTNIFDCGTRQIHYSRRASPTLSALESSMNCSW